MASELSKKDCVPCRGGTPPLEDDRVQELLKELDQWGVEQEFHLTKTFGFSDFSGALEFVNRVGEVAEEQNHHPDLHLAWGRVRVEVWTHKIKGLTESDFILAAKIDGLFDGS